jgi:hypothetical protein
MVVIECPSCDEDIEMDDDAVGLFDCPYCDQEFEWGTDDDDLDIDLVAFDGEMVSASEDNQVEHYQPGSPALRITAGVGFSVLSGIYAIASIMIIIGGLFVSGIEDAIGEVADVESSVGGMIILFGIVMFLLYAVGIFFGVQLAIGRFYALVACSVIAGISLVGTIISWVTDDSQECKVWEIDDWSGMEMCVEYGDPSFPIGATIIWATVLGALGVMLLIPKFRYQFD